MKKFTGFLLLLGIVFVVISLFSGVIAATPTPTKKPTPTINPTCVCTAQNVCSTQCKFNKYTGVAGITYSTSIKCSLTAATLNPTPATATQKNDWCRRPNRTKGDATGEDAINITDYFYYTQARFGGKIPASVNVDFNGDGLVNGIDRLIIVHRLVTGL